jgi:hypothetical protein
VAAEAAAEHKANFMHFGEHEDGVVEVEHTSRLSTGQKHFLRTLEHVGKTLRYVTCRR